jgi:methylated-DNA-protein-cysteine methyltransferase-like protein
MNEMPTAPEQSLIARIYEAVAQVPSGAITTYGDIAAVVGDCDARAVGVALQHLPKDLEATVPWQRVINAAGGISTRGTHQRTLLEREGVQFDVQGHVDLARYRWSGPTREWAEAHGFHTVAPPPPPEAEHQGQLRLF